MISVARRDGERSAHDQRQRHGRPSLERFSFGDGPDLADGLAQLVPAGKAGDLLGGGVGPKAQVGKQSVVRDGCVSPLR